MRKTIYKSNSCNVCYIYILPKIEFKLFMWWNMAYSIHGRTSYRQKIELGVLGLSVIKPRCSVYSSACPDNVRTNLHFRSNYWGKYGPVVLFAIKVNYSVVIIFAISCFVHHGQLISCLKLLHIPCYLDVLFFSYPSSNIFDRHFRFHATRLTSNWE